MLIAEIHGHHVEAANGNEDYLTSAVFGHLRYLPPSIFWQELFRHALALPGTISKCLADDLDRRGIEIKKFEFLEIHFWPRHSTFGCPDLILVFAGSDIQPLVILVEAKLWAEKSGTGDFDQIARYLRLLDEPHGLNFSLPESFSSALIYLTERDSLAELEESMRVYINPEKAGERLFRLHWQDIVAVARHVLGAATGSSQLILQDVARFLSGRNLEYFQGFRRSTLPETCFQLVKLAEQRLFTKMPLPLDFQPQPMEFMTNPPKLVFHDK